MTLDNSPWNAQNVIDRWTRYAGKEDNRSAVASSVLKCNHHEEIVERIRAIEKLMDKSAFFGFMDTIHCQVSTQSSLHPLGATLIKTWPLRDCFWSWVQQSISKELRYNISYSSTARLIGSFLIDKPIPTSMMAWLGRSYFQHPSSPVWSTFAKHPNWSNILKVDKRLVWRDLNQRVVAGTAKDMWQHAQEKGIDAKMFIKRLINLGSAQEIVDHLPLVVAGLDRFGDETLTPSRRKMLYERLLPQSPSIPPSQKQSYERLLVHLSRVSICSHVNDNPDVQNKGTSVKRKI